MACKFCIPASMLVSDKEYGANLAQITLPGGL